VVPGGDQEQRGGVRADAIEREQAGGAGSHAGDDQFVGVLELAAGELGAPTQLAHRDPGGVADDVAGAGPQRRQLSDQVCGVMLGEPGPQVVGAGQDGTHPLTVGPVTPRPLAQARQIRPAAPAGA
jgi:hypothetical protein